MYQTTSERANKALRLRQQNRLSWESIADTLGYSSPVAARKATYQALYDQAALTVALRRVKQMRRDVRASY